MAAARADLQRLPLHSEPYPPARRPARLEAQMRENLRTVCMDPDLNVELFSLGLYRNRARTCGPLYTPMTSGAGNSAAAR